MFEIHGLNDFSKFYGNILSILGYFLFKKLKSCLIINGVNRRRNPPSSKHFLKIFLALINGTLTKNLSTIVFFY